MPGESRVAQRTCLGCRGVFGQNELVRLVLAPSGSIVVDYRQKLPGRGAYTCVRRDCLEKACKGKQFERAFKIPGLKVETETLLQDLQRQVVAKLESFLGMGKKASQIIGGSQAVLSELDHRADLGLILLAKDISAGVAEKVERRAKAGGIPCRRLFDKARLGGLLGRAERSVVAFRPGKMNEHFQQELTRFEHIVGEC